MGCRWDLTLQQGPYCRAGDLGFRQCYTPERNIHAPDLPPPYFLTARCLHAPSQDLQSTWHVTASRESQDNFPPSPLLASLQTLPLLPPRPRFPGCNHRVGPRGVPRGQHNPCATCRTGACQGRSRALGDVYSSPWVAPALQGELLRHSSHAQSEPTATRRHRGNRAGGSNSLGVLRSESRPARVAQHKHGPTDASGMQATPQIRGKPSEQQEIQSPMPTHCLPDPREPRAAEPWGSLGTVSVGPAQELPPVPARTPQCQPDQTHLQRGCASAGAGPQTQALLPWDTHTAWLGLHRAPSGCCHLPATALHRHRSHPSPLA